MVRVRHSGSFKNIEAFLEAANNLPIESILHRYGKEGVEALAKATPQDTGKTSQSWGYEVAKTTKGYRLSWTNSNISDGVPVAILIQYGHGTATGGYVEGRDYLNPAIHPILVKIEAELTKGVTHK